MSMTMLVLVARALQQPMKTLKQWRKWFWIIVESLLERLQMILAYRSVHDKQFLRMFRMDIAEEVLTTFYDDLDLLKKFTTRDK